MAATAISGTGGSVTGPSFFATVHKWEVVTENAAHEYSVFGDYDNYAISGLRRHTGSFDFVVESSAVDDMSDIDGLTGATTISLALKYIDDDTDKALTMASVYLDNITITTDVEDIVRGTATFVGNGVAVYAHQSA